MTVYLDTETTGLDSDDEIIAIAIVDAEGQVLLNTLVRPTHHVEWPEAQAINGISPAMVTDAPLLPDIEEVIEVAVAGEDVVSYNAAFDAAFPGPLLRGATSIECCMLDFAELYCDWSDYWASYTWQSLAFASRHVGFEWPDDAHWALADALACRAVWRYLTDTDERTRIDAIIADKQAANGAEWELKRWQDQVDLERRRFEAAKSAELLRRIGLREPSAPCWDAARAPLTRGERIENATMAFTGFLPAQWGKLHRYIDKVPRYQQRSAIPSDLFTRSALRRQGRETWVLESLVPDALYLSPSAKAWSTLYTAEQVARVVASKPLRAGCAPGPGMVHLTTTALRKAGFDPAEFTSVAERYNCIGHAWYYLYEIESDRIRQSGG